MRAESVGELLDPCHALVAALGHDVGRPELACKRLPVRVPAHRDDAFGAQMFRGQHTEQPDRAVADDGHGLARPHLGRHGTEPTGAEHVRGREQRRDEVGIRLTGCGDERAVGVRDPGVFGLRAEGAHRFGVHTPGLIAGAADLARVVRGEERTHHEVAHLDRRHPVPDLGDGADVLVAHRRVIDVFDAAVRPQIRPADAGRGDLDDRVGRFLDGRVLAIVHPDGARGIHDHSAHVFSSSVGSAACSPHETSTTADAVTHQGNRIRRMRDSSCREVY